MGEGDQISLGTDGAQSNNSMDMLRDLREGVLLQKVTAMDATVISSRETVRMATIGGAKALGMEREIGSLESGKVADLIVLDPNSPRMTPLHRTDLNNLYGAVTYASCGAYVRDRIILSFDEAEVLRQGQAVSEYLVENAFRR